MSRINQEILGFTMIDQENNFWCWAATAQSVAKFYDEESELTQCEIATDTINASGLDCCNGGACNTPWTLGTALETTGNLAEFIPEPITWERLVDELSNDRVVCALMRWDNSCDEDNEDRIEEDKKDCVGHFVTVYGFVEDKDGLQMVYVEDPSTNQPLSFIPFEEFQKNYLSNTFGDRGRWIQTFLTIA